MKSTNIFSLSEDEIINLCGSYPTDFIEIDFESNPDFVFENDINYEAVKLFDVEGNTVFVNSFTECHHYANGGWNYTPTLRNESDYHDFLVVFSIVAIFLANLFFRKFLKIGKR
ncbi:hypothetical protein OAY98_00170 [Acidimicrobiaceae bacterium]|nr:hypothetical protein [Acidimicrobiaceae bacterium]